MVPLGIKVNLQVRTWQNIFLDIQEAVKINNIPLETESHRRFKKGKHSCINQMACHSLKVFGKRLLSSFRSVVLQGLAAEHWATHKARSSGWSEHLSPPEAGGKGTVYQNHLLLSGMGLVCHCWKWRLRGVKHFGGAKKKAFDSRSPSLAMKKANWEYKLNYQVKV